ncbi:MAG: class I SAM-dependent methyltransferase [Dermatophilaceae bacterium]|nr:class I SAM-dependent methyltransferase [Intrasporangiaceae bacterium]
MMARTWWEHHVLPRLVDVVLSDAVSHRWRELVCSGASGRVLEVGFGSGHNLSFYPDSVTEVLAVEPIDLAWERARSRAESFHRPVHRVGLDGAALPVESGSIDTVVSTWTMCTIPHIEAAIDEMRRVLRPSGTLLYVEHVSSAHTWVDRIQRGVQPVWGQFSGGCHLDRDIESLLEAGGFTITPLSSRTDPASLHPAPFVAGAARPV